MNSVAIASASSYNTLRAARNAAPYLGQVQSQTPSARHVFGTMDANLHHVVEWNHSTVIVQKRATWEVPHLEHLRNCRRPSDHAPTYDPELTSERLAVTQYASTAKTVHAQKQTQITWR